MKSNYRNIDSPALLIDEGILLKNIKYMQGVANAKGVNLRAHTKSHKMPDIAKMQMAEGAIGIAVAKVGEAEVMADHGMDNIFIANEIVGVSKIERIAALRKKISIMVGIDNCYQVDEINAVFQAEGLVANVLIEIEIGENRSGVIEEKDFVELVNYIGEKSFVNLKGIFSHDGHSYHAESLEMLEQIYMKGQRDTLKFVELAKALNQPLDIVSVGSTPPFLFDFELLDGITELRLGTYALMDVAQGNVIGTYDKCAATILTTVISKPTAERVITDAGSKSLTAQIRSGGMVATQGYGFIKGSETIYINALFDEHGIIYNEQLSKVINVGDKIEVIPNHICPVCNLYDSAYLVSNGQILKEMSVAARGKYR